LGRKGAKGQRSKGMEKGWGEPSKAADRIRLSPVVRLEREGAKTPGAGAARPWVP